MLSVIPLLLVVALVFAGFYYWAKRQGVLAVETAGEELQGERRISLLTEAVAYVGAILLLAGGGAAIGQRWDDISDWGHVGIFAGAAALFLVLGIIVRGIREPAVQRLVGVVWFLSVAGVAGAVAFATYDVFGNTGDVTALVAGIAVTVYSATLWVLRRQPLQQVAVFAGLIVTICGAIVTIADGPAPPLAFAVALWVFGLAWAILGWQRYVEPLWVAIPLGVLLALIAPIFGIGEHGWMYALGIATAALVMAAAIPLRNTALLALGTIAMFGYVTSTVTRYFGDTLGVPAALAITGALILGLAIVSARLMRATRPPTSGAPGEERPTERDFHKIS